jgi:amino acid transporter/nucleotide-binding universal stress UspA family protein
MLYGDWGTSRFYVLGLAFYFALYSSFWYILGVGILVAAVGWAYTVVCRVYPDGGGVYTAARQISPLLSVIGALMLFANYAVTAALSAFDGMHYLGLEAGMSVKLGACLSILILIAVNYVGPRHAGQLALIIAVATLILTFVLACFAVPHVPEGWRQVMSHPLQGSMPHRWTTLVSVVLALSGVEVIANMTGIMVQPVARTAKQSIWPVLIEVVFFNLLLGVAMLALPAMMHAASPAAGEFEKPAAAYHDADHKIAEYRDKNRNWNTPEGRPAYNSYVETLGPHSSDNEEQIKLKALRVMGSHFVAPWFGTICGVVFGLLLLSAVNTVIGGMMSVAYVMARDHELPHLFAKLNPFGVPWFGLLPAIVVPVLLLSIFSTLEKLADLYAMGVVGAIAINLTCCTINLNLPLKKHERAFIAVVAVVMIAMELTLAIQKPHALVFILIILGVGLGARLFTKSYLPARALQKARALRAARQRDRAAEEAVAGEAEEAISFGTPAEQLDMSKPQIMVATRGGARLLSFAADYAKQADANLFVIYVRPWNVQFAVEGSAPTLEEDEQAQAVFRAAEASAKAKGVAMVPIYAVSRDVAETILDFAATYNVKALLMGVSRQGTLLRALRGDVLAAVADQLPQDIPLLIHA